MLQKALKFNRLENETPVFDNLLFLDGSDIRIFQTLHQPPPQNILYPLPSSTRDNTIGEKSQIENHKMLPFLTVLKLPMLKFYLKDGSIAKMG